MNTTKDQLETTTYGHWRSLGFKKIMSGFQKFSLPLVRLIAVTTFYRHSNLCKLETRPFTTIMIGFGHPPIIPYSHLLLAFVLLSFHLAPEQLNYCVS